MLDGLRVDGVKWIADAPAPNWLHGTLAHHSRAAYEFYDLLNPHAPPAAWRDVTEGWFSSDMPDLNQENVLVSRYLIQNALRWVETANLDGIRLDTFPYVSRAFWHDFHAALHKAFPHLTTVGEVYHRDPEVTSFFAGGAVLSQHRSHSRSEADSRISVSITETVRQQTTSISTRNN